jgi:hypothetical protein
MIHGRQLGSSLGWKDTPADCCSQYNIDGSSLDASMELLLILIN